MTHVVEGWQTDRALKKCASMIAYKTKRDGYTPRGWWVREYHSPVAMANHLKGKKGLEGSYGETGPFRTEEEAREYALAPLSPDWGRA